MEISNDHEELLSLRFLYKTWLLEIFHLSTSLIAEVDQSGLSKVIWILAISYEEFYQTWPAFCYPKFNKPILAEPSPLVKYMK